MIEVEVQHARIKSEMVQVLTADQKSEASYVRGQASGTHARAHGSKSD